MQQAQTPPLFTLEPDKKSPERKRRMVLLSLGVLGVAILFAAPLFLPLSRTDARTADTFGFVCSMLLALFLYLQLGRRGGYHIAYEFYADHMQLKHLQYNSGRHANKKGQTGYVALYYFEIEGLETVTNPYCSDGKLVDVHVKVISRTRRRTMCGALNIFDKDFYLYSLHADENPQARIQEIMRRWFKDNPAQEEFRQKLMAEEQLIS